MYAQKHAFKLTKSTSVSNLERLVFQSTLLKNRKMIGQYWYTDDNESSYSFKFINLVTVDDDTFVVYLTQIFWDVSS